VFDIHMKGAVSQVDTFDYKPEVIKRHGEEIPPSVKGNAKISSMSNGQTTFPLMGPLAPFRQYGKSGRWVSDLMPHIGSIADDLTSIHSVWTPQVNHDPADILMHTGFQLPGRPSAGAWVNYALGSDNDDPGFYRFGRRRRVVAVSLENRSVGGWLMTLAFDVGVPAGRIVPGRGPNRPAPARQNVQAEIGLGGPARPVACHEVAEVMGACHGSHAHKPWRTTDWPSGSGTSPAFEE
jgi:hypothetical protein